eukprot:2471682-Rhodomonas_salina.3
MHFRSRSSLKGTTKFRSLLTYVISAALVQQHETSTEYPERVHPTLHSVKCSAHTAQLCASDQRRATEISFAMTAELSQRLSQKVPGGIGDPARFMDKDEISEQRARGPQGPLRLRGGKKAERSRFVKKETRWNWRRETLKKKKTSSEAARDEGGGEDSAEAAAES